MQELTHYIDGAHVNGTSGRFADVMNPATGEVQAKVPLASTDEVAQAIEIALLEVPGEVQEIELEKEDGMLVYEVEIINADGEEYEVEIAADTGAVIEVEAEDDEDDDD